MNEQRQQLRNRLELLEDIRCWLLDRIDGSEETKGDDGLISDFIRKLDALSSEMGTIPTAGRCKHGVWLSDQCYSCAKEQLSGIAEPKGCPTPGSCSAVAEIADLKQRLLPQANGRAERAEKARQMAVVERDELLEKLIVRQTTVANLHDVIDGMRGAAPSATAAPKDDLVQQLNGALMNSMGQDFEISAAFVRDELIPALKAARVESATAAPSVWTCVYNGLVEKPCKVCDCEMKGYAPQAPQVEETAIGHARYEYLRTLNPREFAALYDEALHGTADNFDDLVDRRRMKGGSNG